MTKAASAAFGMYLNNGVKNSNARTTTRLDTTFEIPVFAPAAKFIADLENDPLTG